tara:strand:- start:273 stop:554 length:282 start_codon:yes stop_codon:yes gene_type:complete
MSIFQIYEGWRNNLFPPEKLKEVIEQTSASRMDICNNCEYISTKHKTFRKDVHCTQCGCTLSAKTKCISCECPLKKWMGLITQDQEEEINHGK